LRQQGRHNLGLLKRAQWIWMIEELMLAYFYPMVE